MSDVLGKITDFFGNFSSDVLLLVSLCIIVFAGTMYFGRGRMVTFVIAFFPAALLYKTFPYLDKLVFLEGDKSVAMNKLLIFLVILIFFNIVIGRFVFSSGDYVGSGGIFKNGLLTISVVFLLLVMTYDVVNLDALHDFSERIDQFFIPSTKIFYFNLISLLVLAFI